MVGQAVVWWGRLQCGGAGCSVVGQAAVWWGRLQCVGAGCSVVGQAAVMIHLHMFSHFFFWKV